MVSVYGTQGSVLSVNVAEMRAIERRGEMVRTGIWKRPVEGPVAVRGVNVEGDDQGDRSVHGGPDKAVYAYAREDIDWWERVLGRELPDGVFGENLTLRGIDPASALVGERWRVGSVLLEVSEPRFPCWKLGVRFGDPGMLKRFAAARRTGTYLRIAEQGSLQADDAVEVVSRPDHDLSIAAFAHAFLEDRSQLPRLLIPEVSEAWRDWVLERAA
ncbi:MAG TPA: MOSC domain-containing protein [Thermoleophilaceae bacterium]|jgi:MOSC domain-containing protein YiiM|nr:MOSC domain-containing protein [Thermoleophilaceae bacterium]